MKRERATIAKRVAALLLVAGTVAACSSGSKASTSKEASTSSAPAASGSTVSLKGACPDPIVLQTDWFPEADHGYTYQLIGTGGKVDKNKGAYTGPLLDPDTGGSTGVNLEIRAGGPFIGQQPPVAQMYADPKIFIAYADTGDQVRNSKKLPTVAVFAPLNKSPQVLMYDPGHYDFKSFADIGRSKARVLYFEGSVYMDYLVSKGYIRKSQLDGSFDGSFSRFISDGGSDVLQGYATREPFEISHHTPAWNKPVKSLLVYDAGYKIYQSALVVRPETITKYHDCLKKLVPLFQKGMIHYLADPKPTNDQIDKVVDTLGTFWKVTPEGDQFAVEQMKKLDIVANSPDGSYGSFDDARVQSVIDAVMPIFKSQNLDSFKPDVKPADIVTNEFIDKSIKLPQ